jgi:hypothetical protein
VAAVIWGMHLDVLAAHIWACLRLRLVKKYNWAKHFSNLTFKYTAVETKANTYEISYYIYI